MGMTPHDAWQEEAYDRMVDEILESHRDEIIDELAAERMASYYQNNPNLTEAAESALVEARSLLKSSPTASLVFSRSATEIALRDVLLKPLAYGMVHDEKAGSLLVELVIRNRQFTELLFGVLEYYGVDLKSFTREGASDNIWAEIGEIAKTRNRILHRGEKASDEQANRSIKLATILLDKIYPSLRRQILQQ